MQGTTQTLSLVEELAYSGSKALVWLPFTWFTPPPMHYFTHCYPRKGPPAIVSEELVGTTGISLISITNTCHKTWYTIGIGGMFHWTDGMILAISLWAAEWPRKSHFKISGHQFPMFKMENIIIRILSWGCDFENKQIVLNFEVVYKCKV